MKVSNLFQAVAVGVSILASHAYSAPIVVNGTLYDSVEWTSTDSLIVPIDSETTFTGSWSLGGGGTLVISGDTAVRASSDNAFAFSGTPYAAGGYEIAGVDQIEINTGQAVGGVALVQNYDLTAEILPTTILFYIGQHQAPGQNGLKYASWNFSTTDASTTFSVLTNTPSFSIQDDGTSNLSWRTFGSDNNTATILVSISNPNGISNFSVISNRLNVTGDPMTYTADAQRADFSAMGFLIGAAVPEPSSVAMLMIGGALCFFRARRR